MLRKTLTILSLIGLLLSVVLWGVSYWNVQWTNCARTRYVSVSEGAFWMGTAPKPVRDARSGIRMDGFRGLRTTLLPHYSITVRVVVTRPDGTSQIMNSFFKSHYAFPLWMPTALFVFPLWLFFLSPVSRRRKRKKLGLCVKCGYDLRASKGRCPECGEAFEK